MVVVHYAFYYAWTVILLSQKMKDEELQDVYYYELLSKSGLLIPKTPVNRE
jgi:hypothetical protein